MHSASFFFFPQTVCAWNISDISYRFVNQSHIFIKLPRTITKKQRWMYNEGNNRAKEEFLRPQIRSSVSQLMTFPNTALILDAIHGIPFKVENKTSLSNEPKLQQTKGKRRLICPSCCNKSKDSILLQQKTRSKDSSRRPIYYHGSTNQNKRPHSHGKHHISHQEHQTNPIY